MLGVARRAAAYSATIAVVASLTQPVRAQPSITEAGPSPTAAQRRMSRRMHAYFRGELNLASAALGLGAGSGYVGGMLLTQATDSSRAAAVPVLAVGLGELAIGIGLFLRTPSQVRALDAQIAHDPQRFVEEEGARMEGVVDQFGMLEIVELSLVLAGITTAGIGVVLDEDRAIGAGIGTAAQAAVALTIDVLAASRADRYLGGIHSFRELRAGPLIIPTRYGNAYGVTLGSAF
jgi:hypothetical protein